MEYRKIGFLIEVNQIIQPSDIGFFSFLRDCLKLAESLRYFYWRISIDDLITCTLKLWMFKLFWLVRRISRKFLLSLFMIPNTILINYCKSSFTPDPTIRTTVLWAVFPTILIMLSQVTTNQASLQRFYALGSGKKATMYAQVSP